MAMATEMELEEDINLVEIWLRRDYVRWVAGALAGAFAGVMAIIAGMVIVKLGHGQDVWYPVKLMATPILGRSATDFAMDPTHLIVGFLMIEAICVFWGVMYGHFVSTNRIAPLLAMGLVWGLFSWIFTWNLFLQSFKMIFATHTPSGAVFFVCLAYGFSLASISLFDRLFRKRA